MDSLVFRQVFDFTRSGATIALFFIIFLKCIPMKILKLLTFLSVTLAVPVFFAGCGAAEDVEQRDVYFEGAVVLTMEAEGDGTVTPFEGENYYEENESAILTALPAEGWMFKEWVGDVLEHDEEQTTIFMDEDKTVKAVFVEEPLAFDDEIIINGNGRSVRGQVVMEGEGVTSKVDVWNCSGFEGEWNWEHRLNLHGFGSAEGKTTFVMPPRPKDEDKEWRSYPINAEFGGTIATVDDYSVTINVVYKDNIAVLTEWTPDSMLMTWDGVHTVTATVPQIGVVSQETMRSSSEVPLLVKYDNHPACD